MIRTDCSVTRVPIDVCLCVFIEGKGKQVDLSMSPTLIVTDRNWEDICETKTDSAKAGLQTLKTPRQSDSSEHLLAFWLSLH